MVWYLWQIRTAVKYIQILRQHTTHEEKKHQVLFATTRKSNKKHTHFLKEAFLLLFLNPPLQNIWRHFLSSFCVCICKSFLLFYMFFCTRIYHLKQASQALVNVTDMFSFCRVWFWRIEKAESLNLILSLHLSLHSDVFLSVFCLFFFFFTKTLQI